MMVARNSCDEVANFGVKEFQKAADLPPLKQTGGDFGDFTSGSALAGRPAHSSIWHPAEQSFKRPSEMASCGGYTRRIICSNQYSLDPDYQGLFYKLQGAPRSLFQRLYAHGVRHWFNWYNQPNVISDNLHLRDSGDGRQLWDGRRHNARSDTLYMDPSNPFRPLSMGNRPAFLRNGRMRRSEFLVNRPVEYWVNEDGKHRWSWFRILRHWKLNYSKVIIQASSLPKTLPHRAVRASNLIYCRLAEIYLIHAEAKYMLGDDATARTYASIRSEKELRWTPRHTPGRVCDAPMEKNNVMNVR